MNCGNKMNSEIFDINLHEKFILKTVKMEFYNLCF